MYATLTQVVQSEFKAAPKLSGVSLGIRDWVLAKKKNCHGTSESGNEFHIYFLLVSLFVLFEWALSQRKEVGIPLGILPHVQEQNKRSYFPKPGLS